MLTKKERKVIITALGRAWDYFPEYRLGQLLANLMGHHTDPFYWQDEKLKEKLEGK